MANARPLASTDFGGGIESVHSHDALDPAVSRYEYGTCFQYTPALYCTSINQSIRIYWNEPVYRGHYYSFNTHTMRAFALPGMPGLAYASYWPLGQFYYNLIWLVRPVGPIHHQSLTRRYSIYSPKSLRVLPS